jgi:uncharacterized membrane protein YeaQ/YmgE (transglycosylase-associated protein family)
MRKEDRAVGAIVFGIILVIGTKVVQVVLTYLFPIFAAANQYAVVAIAGVIGAMIAVAVTRKFFPRMFG